MKKLLYIILVSTLFIACSSSENESDVTATEQLSIKPYSCDITENEIVVVYQVTGSDNVTVVYKDQSDEDWTPVEVKDVEGKIAVSLTNLQLRHYYFIFATVQDDKGQTASNTYMVKYDYDPDFTTLYAQPFLQWGGHVSGVKTAMADKGGVLDSEVETANETHLTYRFFYKELWSEYVFDDEKHLKEVFVYFDKNRVSLTELRRYVSLAFSYLEYGNIHLNIDGKEEASTLLRTAEGTSYVILFEKGEYNIVNYMSTAGIDITETQYK